MPASWYSEIFDIAFKDLDRSRAKTVWAEQLKEAEKEKKKKEDDD